MSDAGRLHAGNLLVFLIQQNSLYWRSLCQMPTQSTQPQTEPKFHTNASGQCKADNLPPAGHAHVSCDLGFARTAKLLISAQTLLMITGITQTAWRPPESSHLLGVLGLVLLVLVLPEAHADASWHAEEGGPQRGLAPTRREYLDPQQAAQRPQRRQRLRMGF